MPDKILTPNIHLSENDIKALINYSSDNGISAEQMASQIVKQWIKTVLEPDRVRTSSR